MPASDETCRWADIPGTADLPQSQPYFQRLLVVVVDFCCGVKGSTYGPLARRMA